MLPKLPKQNKRKEADFGIVFRRYLKQNPWGSTAHFELKQTEGESLLFSSLEDRQIAFLEAVAYSSKGVLMRNISGNGEPDYSYLYRDPVYIVVKYPKEFFIIRLFLFLEVKNTSNRKSLTREMARKIATEAITI